MVRGGAEMSFELAGLETELQRRSGESSNVLWDGLPQWIMVGGLCVAFEQRDSNREREGRSISFDILALSYKNAFIMTS